MPETHALLDSRIADKVKAQEIFETYVKENPDNLKTFQGISRWLLTEMKRLQEGMGANEFKRKTKAAAKRFMLRQELFLEGVSQTLPNSVRLSMHPSSNREKISIALVPQPQGLPNGPAPWMGSAVKPADPKGAWKVDYYDPEKYDVVDQNGKPIKLAAEASLDYSSLEPRPYYMVAKAGASSASGSNAAPNAGPVQVAHKAKL